MRCKCLTWYTEMQAQIKTLLPASMMVKISLTDSSQITPLLSTLISLQPMMQTLSCDPNTQLSQKKKKKSTHKRCNIAGIWAASDSSIRTAQYPLTNTNGWIRSDCMSCSDVRCCAPLTCQQQLHIKRQKWGGGGYSNQTRRMDSKPQGRHKNSLIL